MIKIVPPACDSCNGNAAYHSDSLGVHFCYQCIYTIATYFSREQLLESNWLCQELFDGVWDSIMDSYRVWFRTPGAPSNSSSDRYLNRVEKKL